MAYGLHITNTSGDLLVSSDIKSYHYVGSPTYTGVQSSYNNYSGSRIYRYTLTNSETPLIFIKPADTSKFYAVLTHFKSGNNWTYDVIGSGTSNQPPTLYAFSALSGSNSSGGYGLLVQDDSGNRTFDSRDKPLAIVDIVSAIPPANAPDGGATSTSAVDPGWHDCDVATGYRPGMEHNFNSNNSHNDYSYSSSGHNSNYMFSAPSIAQSAWRKNGYHYHCDGCGKWYQANQYHEFWGDLGVFYRQAYKLTSSQVQAGWCSVKEFWWGKPKKHHGLLGLVSAMVQVLLEYPFLKNQLTELATQLLLRTQLIMYSRVFINGGELYKETPLVLNEPYVFYEHEGETYLTKPGKVYVEPYHSEFNYYIQNYDTSILGSIIVVGVQQNGDVEIYFDNPDQMDAIATYYSLTKPFASDVIKFKDDSLMSIRFNSSKVAYLYKGYATRDASNRTPVATMYIDELDDTLWVYHEEDDSGVGRVIKHMSMEKDTSAVVETKPGPFEDNKITIDGVLYYPSDYDYVEHNGYSNTTLQGDPYTNSNVTKLHE